MANFVIEDGIEIPRRVHRGSICETMRKLQVGQSFFVAGNMQQSITNSGYMMKKRGVCFHRFVTRKVEENGVKGVRVWRIEDHKDAQND